MDIEKCFHKKLIRDKIPEHIENNGGKYEIRELSIEEFGVELRKKLIEESYEVEKAGREELLGELADVMEVVKAITETNGLTMEEVEQQRIIKLEKRGGFEKKLFLEWSTNQ